MEPIAKVAAGSNRGSAPGERRGGRTAGTPNKVTASLKAAILGALEAKGGQCYLEKVADEDPRTFCTLLGKVLPMQIEPSEEASELMSILSDLNGRTRGLPSEQKGMDPAE